MDGRKFTIFFTVYFLIFQESLCGQRDRVLLSYSEDPPFLRNFLQPLLMSASLDTVSLRCIAARRCTPLHCDALRCTALHRAAKSRPGQWSATAVPPFRGGRACVACHQCAARAILAPARGGGEGSGRRRERGAGPLCTSPAPSLPNDLRQGTAQPCKMSTQTS